jgi:hypothetical protein
MMSYSDTHKLNITSAYHLSQLNYRYTPLQTLTIQLIIETSSEH